jgi:hypothetical protein
MTATTTSNLDGRRALGRTSPLRRVARATAHLMAAIGARWSDFVDAGQLGPDAERTIGRHTGARI